MKKSLIIKIVLVILFAVLFFVSYKRAITPQVTDQNMGGIIEIPITYVKSSSDMIVVELPFPGSVTGKEFSVIGKARGTWFFEASFPITVLDKDGNTIAQGIAQAQNDWMTTEFVPFKADIKIPDTYIGKATLVLRKDNPSGLPEHDASISFPFTIEY